MGVISFGAKPVSARMCTWEFVTTFDGHPSEEQLLKQFRLEYPQVDVSKILVTLMTSLNSAEGRKLRYLVMMLEDGAGDNRKLLWDVFSRRWIPRQSWLFGWADKNFPDANGNCLFWKVWNNVLYILVFFEGRLCHWSEEAGYESLKAGDRNSFVENRLARFRKFLKTDALFSRGEKFAEVAVGELNAAEERKFFVRATKDSFWKNMDLKFMGKKFVQDENRVQKIGLWGGMLLSVAFLVLVGFILDGVMRYVTDFGESYVMEKIEDVVPVELSLPALIELTEERRSSIVEKTRMTGRICALPEIQMKGVVKSKLFMANIDGTETAKPFCVGDTLGDFVVQEIERSQVRLVCGDSSAVIAVR